MARNEDDIGFPGEPNDERELLLEWLGYLRGAVLRKVEGIDDEQARWTPDGRLIPLIGIVHHLTRVEWRWIEGGFRGADVDRSESEFAPGQELRITDAVVAYRERAAATDAAVRSMELAQRSEPDTWRAASRFAGCCCT